MYELAINLNIPVKNVFVAKQLIDGMIWKAGSMHTWLKSKVDDAEVKLEKQIEDGVAESEIERTAGLVALHEESMKEVVYAREHLVKYYRAQFNEEPPSMTERTSSKGAAKAVLERIKARKAA